MNLKEVVWHTPDMECEGCVRSIHRALDDIDGVHPSEAGHTLIAQAWLEAVGVKVQ